MKVLNKNIIIIIIVLSSMGHAVSIFSEANIDTEMNPQEQSEFYDSLISSIKDHPIYLEAQASVEQTKASLDIIKSSKKPRITIQGNIRNSLMQEFENPLSSFSESTRNQHRTDGSIIIQQVLFDRTIMDEIVKQEYIFKGDIFEKQQKVSELTKEMALICQDTAAYKIIGDLIEISVQSHLQILNRIEMRVDSGRAAQVEMTKAKARFAEARAKKIAMDLKLKSSKAKFMQLMPNTKPCIKFINIDQKDLIIRKKLLEDELENNFILLKATEIIKASETNLELSKSSYMPRINFELRGDRYDFTGPKNYDLYAGINVNLDIYNGGKRSAMVRLAKEQLKSSKFKREIFKKSLMASSESNFVEIINTKNRLDVFSNAYEAYEDNREKLRLQFESSNVSLLELLQAERDYIESAELFILNKKGVISSQINQLFLTSRIMMHFEENIQIDNGVKN
jgi:outer membrane protein TolC